MQNEREKDFLFNISQTREQFKRCINICCEAAMEVRYSKIQGGKNLWNLVSKVNGICIIDA